MRKLAVVTGANRGIGLAFCQHLVQQNYEVVALCRQSSPELSSLGIIIHENVHVERTGAVHDLAKNLSFLRIDLLINNAGVGLSDNLKEVNYDEVLRHFKINALGPLIVSRAFLPLMREGSKIAMISSRLASIAGNNSGSGYAYRMSKTALNMLGKNLAVDLAYAKIWVAVLSPGMVDTDMQRAASDQMGQNPAEAVAKMMHTIDGLGPENSGSFWHIDGSVMAW